MLRKIKACEILYRLQEPVYWCLQRSSAWQSNNRQLK